MTNLRNALLILTTIALASCATAQDEWARHIRCDVSQAATGLPDLDVLQGETPRLSLDLYNRGQRQAPPSGSYAVVQFAPTATAETWVIKTNSATGSYSYTVQLPQMSTNTTATGDWWWTAQFYTTEGYRYWTGNGDLSITETTGNGTDLTWQTIAAPASCNAVTQTVNALAYSISNPSNYLAASAVTTVVSTAISAVDLDTVADVGSTTDQSLTVGGLTTTGTVSVGTSNTVTGNYAVAIGQTAIAGGNSSLAIGSGQTYGVRSLSAGFRTQARGEASIAFGNSCVSHGNYSSTFGIGAVASNNNEFVWTGTNPYYGNGASTFNINPSGGTSGFYIGSTNLATILSGVGGVWTDNGDSTITYTSTNTAGTTVTIDAPDTMAANATVFDIDRGVSIFSVDEDGDVTQNGSIQFGASSTRASLSYGALSLRGSPITIENDSINGGIQIGARGSANIILGYWDGVVADNNVGIGTNAPDTKLDLNGILTLRQSTQAASAPDAGSSQIWMSDGNGAGDAGDIMAVVNNAGTVTTNKLGGVSIVNSPDILTSASTVTVTSANSPYIALTLTNNVTLFTIDAAGFPTNTVGGFTMDLDAGAYSFGFDTSAITNSTLLDISTNSVTPLFFRKPYGSAIWRVRQ